MLGRLIALSILSIGFGPQPSLGKDLVVPDEARSQTYDQKSLTYTRFGSILKSDLQSLLARPEALSDFTIDLFARKNVRISNCDVDDGEAPRLLVLHCRLGSSPENELFIVFTRDTVSASAILDDRQYNIEKYALDPTRVFVRVSYSNGIPDMEDGEDLPPDDSSAPSDDTIRITPLSP